MILVLEPLCDISHIIKSRGLEERRGGGGRAFFSSCRFRSGIVKYDLGGRDWWRSLTEERSSLSLMPSWSGEESWLLCHSFIPRTRDVQKWFGIRNWGQEETDLRPRVAHSPSSYVVGIGSCGIRSSQTIGYTLHVRLRLLYTDSHTIALNNLVESA